EQHERIAQALAHLLADIGDALRVGGQQAHVDELVDRLAQRRTRDIELRGEIALRKQAFAWPQRALQDQLLNVLSNGVCEFRGFDRVRVHWKFSLPPASHRRPIVSNCATFACCCPIVVAGVIGGSISNRLSILPKSWMPSLMLSPADTFV